MERVAAGQSLSGSSHPFVNVEVQQKAHDLLGMWWERASEAHAPMLMAWAVFAALSGSISEGVYSATMMMQPCKSHASREELIVALSCTV